MSGVRTGQDSDEMLGCAHWSRFTEILRLLCVCACDLLVGACRAGGAVGQSAARTQVHRNAAAGAGQLAARPRR
eukprot:2449242-Rhodomonas_salina.1